MTREEIANILKDARSKAGMTQKQAAEAIGRKQQTLASWETAQSQPDVNTLFVLFDAYGVSVNDAFGFNTNTEEFTARERSLIMSYRKNKSVQSAVDKLLDIKPGVQTVHIFRAESSKNNADAQVLEVPKSTIDRLKAAPEVKSDDDI